MKNFKKHQTQTSKRLRFIYKAEDVATPYGRIVREKQMRYGISNEDLAARAGICSRTLCRILSGGAANIGTLERILNVFGLELTAQAIGEDYKQEAIE